MARQQGKARSLLEYIGMMCGYALLAYLPLRMAVWLVSLLAEIWRRLDRRHEAIAIGQMTARLKVSPDEAKRLARANYRHYCLLALEICRMSRMSLEEIEGRARVNGADATCRELLAEGKGVVVITGHLGNWECGSVILGRVARITGALARPMDNPYLDSFLNRNRERGGVRVWNKFGGMRSALAALKKGEGFVAVADQDGGHGGIPAPFLGRVGSTMAMPVDLAIRAGAPIIVGGVMRDGEPLKFTVDVDRILRPRPDADPEEERTRLLGEMNDGLGNIIRRHPEQWIWIHRRWRTNTYTAIKYNTPEWRRLNEEDS